MSRKERTKDQVLGHADEADGIEEYDNPLPDWWLGLFWFTIVWALAYTLHYHFIAERSQEKELAAEIAAAEARYAPAADVAGPLVVTEALATAGRAVYQTNCLACHGAALEGGIGPSLRDGAWIHGGSPEEIVKTVSDGVPAKGMPAWGPILGVERVRQVTAYIMSEQAN
jgi:cytochrome c oxidase cbb3-type subunit III